MSDKHLSTQFDTDLTSISTKVLQMGGLVEAQIARAMRALANFDAELCDQVLAVELEVNARRQPTARDLRLVMAISKTITNLERAGDEAEKIAKRTKRLMQDPLAHSLNYADVKRSGEMAATILRHALDAFARLDTVEAVSILKEDKAIDEEFRGAGPALHCQGHRADRRPRQEHR
jgi:phosphate transport system protein